MARRSWTADDDATLLQMRGDGHDAVAIGQALGRTAKSCTSRFFHINERARRVAAGETRKQAQRAFTAAEVADLIRMRDVERMTFPAIGDALGRAKSVCRQKYNDLTASTTRPSEAIGQTRAMTVPPKQVADRDRRAALSHASLTSAFFGDPLPGDSALDLKRRSTATP